MTTARCAAATIGEEVQLEDKRDGNKYWIGKMKDGKCWILQNLALDLTTDGLKAGDTNITSDWNSSSTYPPKATEQTVTKTAYTSETLSWNFGKWVLATPELTANCGASGSIPSLSSCAKVGFVDVSGLSFSAGYTAATSSWEGINANSSTLVAVNCTSWSGSGTSKTCTAGTYDEHYLTGNYYQWYAATAGTGAGLSAGEEASGSICPKGWKLPISNSMVTGSFGGLLSQYGVSSSPSGIVDGVTYNIAGSPLRFVRGGTVVPSSSSNLLGYAGHSGAYWSSTNYSVGTDAYRLSFNNISVLSSSNVTRRRGDSVRCIAE